MKTTRFVAAFALPVALLSAQHDGLEKPVRLHADGELIDTGKDIGYAGPLMRDHDGDGKPDLLVSSFRGNIRFFRNFGTRAQPKFTSKGLLQAAGEDIRIHNW